MGMPQLFDFKSDGPRFEAPDASGRGDAPKRGTAKATVAAERIDRGRLDAKLPEDGANAVQRYAWHDRSSFGDCILGRARGRAKFLGIRF
jgi:hypothetical protein